MAEDVRATLDALTGEDYCYLTTVGRRTGNPHTVEIWFAVHDDALYMLSGGRDRSDWVKNIQRNPAVQVRIGQDERHTWDGQGRVIDAEREPEIDALARRLLATKYQDWREGRPLSGWARTALPVQVQFKF